MKDLTNEDLDQLQAFYDAATPGDWQVGSVNESDEYSDYTVSAPALGVDVVIGDYDLQVKARQAKANMVFITVARNAMPALIAQLRATPPAAPVGPETWVSVADRLPRHGQQVSLFGRAPGGHREVVCATFYHERGSGDPSFHTGYAIFEPSHWQPLPSPPQQKAATNV